MAELQQLDLARIFTGASNLARTDLALQEFARKGKKEDAVREARKEAATGEPEAIKALMALAPKEATSILDNLSKLDEKGRKQVKAQSEETAKQMMWVMQGQDEQDRSSRWDQVVDFMSQSAQTDQAKNHAEQFRGQYSQELAQNWIMKAMTVDDINEQFAFGQLKVGMKGDKPVFLQTNKAGQVRQATTEFTPAPKDVTGAKGKTFGLKASDSNSIRTAAAALFGGTWDPATERISGIEKGQERDALAVSERASQLFNDAQGKLTHDQAAAQAARELGISVKKLGGEGKSIQDFLKEQRK